MEPRIQYAQTADGVSIAFWALGEGVPLVVMPELPWSHIQLEWENPNARRWYELLAEKRRVVRYDSRGTGMSAQDVVDFTLNSQMADLEAVAQRLGLASLALYAPVNSGPAAIAYAARYPKRVSRLVLCNAWARSSDWSRSPQIKALRGLLGRDWETYTETYAHILYGWSEAETAQQVARQMREGMTEEAMLAWADAVRGFDVTECLPQVRAPTLVVQGAQRILDVDVARHLASRMPDARLVVFEDAAGVPFRGETDPLLRAIDEFLGEGEEAAAEAEAPPAGAVHTILFTDVEGSTALTQRLGDARARQVMRAHERIVREALRAHGGAVVKALGDGFMASFSSATRALECAIAMQRAFAQHNETAEEPIRVRIGLNAGEPIAEEEDLFGTAVQLAARICAQAEPGQILAPIVVRELAAGKGFLFSDRGDVALRGFEDPVQLFEVRWRE
jgi:class 3 adenylate cyclase/pimeloyl-ACP methyl ester carboxylesterase